MTASIVAVVLIVGTSVSVSQAVRARRNAFLFSQEAKRASRAEREATAALAAEHDARMQFQRQAYRYGINLAYEAWNRGNRTRFEDLMQQLMLSQSDLGFRGIEWELLSSRYRSLQREVATPVDKPCWSVNYSPDGERLAIACGEVLLRNNRSGSVDRLLPESNVGKVHFSRTGSWLIGSGIDRFASTIAIWKMPEKERIDLSWLKDSTIRSVSLSPDETKIAGVLTDGSIEVRKFPEGNILWLKEGVHANGGDDNEFQLEFAPNGMLLATGSRDNRLCLWNVESGDLLDEKTTQTWVTSLGFSPDSGKLISTGSEGFTRWEVASQKLSGPTLIESGESRGVAFNSNGSLVAIGTLDRAIHLFDLENLQRRAKVLHTSFPTAVDFHPNGNELSVCSRRGGVCSWEAQYWNLNRQRDCSVHWHLNMDVSPEGHIVHTQDTADGYRVVLWDPNSGVEEPLGEFAKSATNLPQPPAVRFSPSGSTLAIGTVQGDLILLDLKNRSRRKIHLHDNRIYSLDFSPDGALIASGGRSPALQVLEIHTGKLVSLPKSFAANEDATWVRFSCDGRLAAGGGDWGKYGRLKLWDFVKDQPEVIMNTKHPELVRCLEFSPDGTRIVMTHDFDSSRFRVYEVSTQKMIFECNGHSTRSMSVMYSGDGRRLISGGDDRSIRFWDASDGIPLGKLETNGRVRALALLPSGEEFASAAREGFIGIWRTKQE